MILYYFLPKTGFFKKGFTGSVMHALGIIEGCTQANINLRVVAGKSEGVMPSETINREWRFSNPLTKYIQLFRLITELKRCKRDNCETKVLIRYSLSEAVYIILISLIARILRIRSILEVNTLLSFYPGKRNAVLERFELFLCRLYSTVYVVSPEARRYFNTKGLPNVIYVPNGISVAELEPKPLKKFGLQAFKYFGSVKHYYNLEFVIEMIRETGYHLEIYGNVPNDFAKKYSSAENVKFKGKYNNAEIYQLVNAESDVLILPYKKNTIAEYGFPTKLGEYLAMGSIVLSTNTGVLKFIFKDKINAFLYSDGDPVSFANAVESIEKLSAEEANMIAVNAKNEVVRYQWKDLVLNIFHEKSYAR